MRLSLRVLAIRVLPRRARPPLNPSLVFAKVGSPARTTAGERFGVLTNLPADINPSLRYIRALGLDARLAGVEAAGIAVVDLADTDRAEKGLSEAAQRLKTAGADVLILGCAGMVGLPARIGGRPRSSDCRSGARRHRSRNHRRVCGGRVTRRDMENHQDPFDIGLFSVDINNAWTLPAPYYSSPEVFEAEKQAIFFKSWRFVGHISEFVKTGDYLSENICGAGNICRPHCGRNIARVSQRLPASWSPTSG